MSSNAETVTAEFADLPDTARLWVFGASRPLADTEEAKLLSQVEAFLEGWKAHGHPMAAAHEWRERRFLLVAADDRVTTPSGCSIDALVRRLRDLERELEISLVGSAPVWFRDGDGLRRVGRSEFKRLAVAGDVTADTVVYDMSVTRLGALREGRWKTRAGSSWHARYLPGDSDPRDAPARDALDE